MTTHHGSCQCGAVEYEATGLDVAHGVTCNCSRCRRLGSVLSFVPRATFTVLKGEDALTEYTFNSHSIRHLFCKTCGIQCFSFATAPDGTEMAAVNLNTVDGVDTRSVEVNAYDGASK